MKSNMGTLDKVIRILVALSIVLLYIFNVISGITAVVLLIIGGIFFITSVIGFCPLYLPFGLSTLRKK